MDHRRVMLWTVRRSTARRFRARWCLQQHNARYASLNVRRWMKLVWWKRRARTSAPKTASSGARALIVQVRH